MEEVSEFTITHLSARHLRDIDKPFIFINIIFKLEQPDDIYLFMSKSHMDPIISEYTKVFGFKTIQDFEAWMNSSSKVKVEKTELYVWNDYVNPLHGFITYIPKFDCYQMKEFYDDSPATRGIIQCLQDIKDGKPSRVRTTTACHFMRLLNALSNFWD